ncbi:MAG TPA: hypothetical protein VKE72_05580 [Methylocella sp.]|nr:hypothetical protein [Methylocella sp.]
MIARVARTGNVGAGLAEQDRGAFAGAKRQENDWTWLLSAANVGDAEAYRLLPLQLTPVLRASGTRAWPVPFPQVRTS